MMTRRIAVCALGALTLLAAAACGKPPAADSAAGDQPMWVGRENMTVAEQRMLEVGPAISGTLAAEREATVRAEVGGAVEAILAEPGQAVSRGAVLARLDESAIRDAYESSTSAVRTAELSVEIARRELQRATALEQAGAIAARDVETSQWSLTSAEGQLSEAKSRQASAEKQLARTVVRAPFSGVVSERPVSQGDIVQTGAVLFTLVDPGSLKFEGAVPAEERAGIKVGTPVSFALAGPDEGTALQGRVTRVNPSVDPATRQVRLTVAVPNVAGGLIAGLYAEGRVAVSSRPGVVVPSGAVDRRGVRPFVVRVKQGRVERVEVELGLLDPALELTEIAGGLAAGDTILLGGARGLRPGSAVRVGSPAELSGTPARKE
jgi:RND family efflux transporter MFP subunit